MLRTARVALLATALASLAEVLPAQTFLRKIPDLPAFYAANDVAVDGSGNFWVVTDLDEVVAALTEDDEPSADGALALLPRPLPVGRGESPQTLTQSAK